MFNVLFVDNSCEFEYLIYPHRLQYNIVNNESYSSKQTELLMERVSVRTEPSCWTWVRLIFFIHLSAMSFST